MRSQPSLLAHPPRKEHETVLGADRPNRDARQQAGATIGRSDIHTTLTGSRKGATFCSVVMLAVLRLLGCVFRRQTAVANVALKVHRVLARPLASIHTSSPAHSLVSYSSPTPSLRHILAATMSRSKLFPALRRALQLTGRFAAAAARHRCSPRLPSSCRLLSSLPRSTHNRCWRGSSSSAHPAAAGRGGIHCGSGLARRQCWAGSCCTRCPAALAAQLCRPRLLRCGGRRAAGRAQGRPCGAASGSGSRKGGAPAAQGWALWQGMRLVVGYWEPVPLSTGTDHDAARRADPIP